MHTDDTSCALDAFNMAVGKRVLTRGDVPEGPVKLVAESEKDTVTCQPAIQRAGYQLTRVGNKKTPPKIQRVLAQRSGVYLVEWYWRKYGGRAHGGDSDWHVAAFNCCQRRMWCNALGVVPFTMMKARESAKTHAELVEELHLVNVTRVWRVLRMK